MLHVNIRSMNKHFENFDELFRSLKLRFSSLRLLETWRNSLDETKNHYFKIRNFGGLCIYLRLVDGLSFNIFDNLNKYLRKSNIYL